MQASHSRINTRRGKKKAKFKVNFFNSEDKLQDVTLPDKCKKEYRKTQKKYKQFFMKCVEEIEDLQPNAFACIQVSRFFTVGVLPKYCVIPDPLSIKERERVERLLKN